MLASIGITALYNHSAGEVFVPESIIAPVVESGGNPVIIPCIPNAKGPIEFIEHLNGLVITGDFHSIDANLYGMENKACLKCGISPYKNAELDLIHAAFQISMPILAVGDGHLTANTALGGTVKQSIESVIKGALKHDYRSTDTPQWCSVHKIKLNGYAKELLGEEISTNSFHTDAVDLIGNGLNVGGCTSDGVCEILESADMNKHYLLSTQFQPELMKGKIRRLIFDDFVHAAVNYR